MSKTNLNWLEPNWPVPKRVQALTTLRAFGDLREPVLQAQLVQAAHLPSPPIVLEQVHGNTVWLASESGADRKADASIAFMPNQVCAVLTADCLPILLYDVENHFVAAIHGGWRGLCANIIQKVIDKMKLFGSRSSNLFAWLGPAISARVFEVGSEVYQQFMGQDLAYRSAFKPSKQQAESSKWLADLYQIARVQLGFLGVEQIYGGEYCTYSEPNKFFSYRFRMQHADMTPGRMMTLIYIAP